MTQYPLFADTLCRRDGPETSRLAAVKVAPTLGDKQAFALAAIRKHPGWTQTELDAEYPDPSDPRRIGKRCSELVRLGLVEVRGPRPCRINGGLKGIYYPVGSDNVDQTQQPHQAATQKAPETRAEVCDLRAAGGMEPSPHEF